MSAVPAREPHPPDVAAQVAALVAVLATLGGLGATSLVAVPVCLLAAVLSVGAVALVRLRPAVVAPGPLRVSLALGLLSVVAVAGSRSAPDLPVLGPFEVVPTGVLAALAAGALIPAVLEFGTVRGLRFGVVLAAAVTALTASLVPGPRIVPALCVGWPAMLFALARANGVDALAPPRSGGPQPPAAGRAVLRWHVVPAVAAILAACAALAALQALGWTHTRGLASGDGIGGAGAGRSGSASATRSGGSYLGSTMDLRMRGPLGDTPVLDVPADSPALWRSGVLDTYQDYFWTAGDGPGERPVVTAYDGGVDLTWPTPVTGVPREDVVRPLTSWASVVVAAGRPDSVRSRDLGRDLGAVTASGERVLFLVGAPSYLVRSTPLPRVADPASAVLLSGTPVGGDAVDPRFTALPPTVPARVRDLGRRLVASAPDRRAAVLAVERELRARLEYRLDSPRPRRGEDPVDDVLFRSHSGFCEQFASAEIVLLRSAGIPARMATGFAGGADDGSRRVLRASDGHAWVEVWFPGVGWVSSDPTAGARQATAWWSDLASLARRVGLWGALGLAVAAGLVGSWLVLRWRRRRSVLSPVPVPPRGREVPAELAEAFARLESALAEAGQARRPSETVAALGARVTVDEGVRRAFTVLERALYARTPPSRAECGTAAGSLDRAAAAVLASLRSP